MKSFRELELWQRATQLAVNVYRLTSTLPQEERFGLTQQMRRAAVSIPTNIAEGWGRGSTKEYIQFLLIARGSATELLTYLLQTQQLGYLPPEKQHAAQSAHPKSSSPSTLPTSRAPNP